MELFLKTSYNNEEIKMNFDNNILLLGKNSLYKTEIINDLFNGFNGKFKGITLNGNKINPKDFNIININEDTDFLSEFKFTKNNSLKQMIYHDVIEKINEKKIIDYTNNIFDAIDNKVNKMLDRKINKNYENNLSFQIEITDINSIIDKFTNIYIDDVLLDDKKITKSMRRKLLYQLYFWEIELNSSKMNIVIIDNFDAYLCTDEIIELLIKINKLSGDNCHFILSSSNNVFEFIDLDLFNIYKVNDRVIPFNNIDIAIKDYIIKREYNKIPDGTDYEKFYDENENLISNDEIFNIKNKLINLYPNYIGKILCSSCVKVVQDRPKHIVYDYIICYNKELLNLFIEISSKFCFYYENN